MNSETGTFHIRSVAPGTKQIRLKTWLTVSPEQLGKTIEVTVCIDEKKSETFTLSKQTGYLTVDVSELVFENKPVKVSVTQDFRWVPDVYLHNGDERIQGIAITDVEFVLPE